MKFVWLLCHRNINVIRVIKKISLRAFVIAFLATRGVPWIPNSACKTLSALITYSSSSVAAKEESEEMRKRVCLTVASREREKERKFLSRQENGWGYIAVDCAHNAVDHLPPFSALSHHVRMKKKTNYLVILFTENFLRHPAVLRYCSTNERPAPSLVVSYVHHLARDVRVVS